MGIVVFLFLGFVLGLKIFVLLKKKSYLEDKK